MVQQRDGFVSSLQQLMDLQEAPEEVKAAAYASLTDTMLLFNSEPPSRSSQAHCPVLPAARTDARVNGWIDAQAVVLSGAAHSLHLCY